MRLAQQARQVKPGSELIEQKTKKKPSDARSSDCQESLTRGLFFRTQQILWGRLPVNCHVVTVIDVFIPAMLVLNGSQASSCWADQQGRDPLCWSVYLLRCTVHPCGVMGANLNRSSLSSVWSCFACHYVDGKSCSHFGCGKRLLGIMRGC